MKRLIIILSTMLTTMSLSAQNSYLTEIVKYATKAPSGHNTQPWKFQLAEDTISIIPNLDNALPVADGSHRELFISLGCAVENLCIAASHYGYICRIVSQSKQGIVIKLNKSNDVQQNPLFAQIEKRQTNRSVYDGRKVAEDITVTTTDPNIHFYFAEIGSPFADTLTQFIIRGNEIQMNDKAFKNELLSWMRFNKRQIGKTGDGLTYQVLGIPSMPGFISKPAAGMFMKTAKQNKSDLEKINSSSHLVVLTTKDNTSEQWINLGRSLERFLLALTASGIANAYMNQPCEIELLAREMQQTCPINGEFPTLILRIGYASSMPYSPRKDVEEVIIP